MLTASQDDDGGYEQDGDVRAQLKFFEQLDQLEKQRKEEQEREILLKAAKVRPWPRDLDQDLDQEPGVVASNLMTFPDPPVQIPAGGPGAAASEAEGQGGEEPGPGPSSLPGSASPPPRRPCPWFFQMQQQELAQLRQREANLTALAAIGPRKKRKFLDSPSSSTGPEV